MIFQRLPLLSFLALLLTAPLSAQTETNSETAGTAKNSVATKPAASEAAPSGPVKLPDSLIPVVLKVDDMKSKGNVPDRWKRITDFAKERNIKLSIGIIADSLEGDKNKAYIDYLNELQKSGLVEFWFHGYDHGVRDDPDGKNYGEFSNRPYEEQKRRFDISQKLAKEKLGKPFMTFGPPGGGKTPPSPEDLEATIKVMSEEPDMKIWLYNQPIDERGKKLDAEGKVVILDRVWKANIEWPLFKPNAEQFKSVYAQSAKGRSYLILQGHPGQWDDARWAEFVKLVDFLQENKIPIVFPSDLAKSLRQP